MYKPHSICACLNLVKTLLTAVVLGALSLHLTFNCTPAAAAPSQSARGNLSGTVYDENGAVISDAGVVAFNSSTGLERRTSTDGEGNFSVPILPAGMYSVTVQRDGFKTVDIRDVSVTDNLLVLRVRLLVGHVSEYVVVTAQEAGGIDGDQRSASVVTTFERGQIENQPLNGRTLQSLINQVAGTVLTKTNFNEQGQFSVNGQRPNANYFTVDGVSANFGVSAGPAPGQSSGGSLPALSSFGGTNNLVSADAVQDLRVHTSTYAAELGRTPGAQVAFTTRSGTNEFHGSAFYSLRRRALDANDWFVNAEMPRPPARNDNAGGVLGGPIVRNRVFFFLSYEWLDVVQPRVALSGVPSARTRELAPPELKPFVEAFPNPSASGRDLGFGMTELAAAYGEPSALSATSLRLDHAVNSALSLFGRFSDSPSHTIQRGGINPPTSTARVTFRGGRHFRQSLSTISESAFETRTLTLGASFAVNPRVTGDFRFNASRALGSTFYRLDDFGGAVPPSDSYFFPHFASAADGLVQIAVIAGQAGNLRIGKDADNTNRQLNFVKTLNIVMGAHHYRFGADYRRLTPIFDAPTYTQTAAFFSFDTSPPPPRMFLSTLSGFANAQVFADAKPRHPVFHSLSLFAQDTWQIGRRLALSYGLRWEFSPPPRDASGQHPAVVSDPLVLRKGMLPSRLDLEPAGTPLWKTTYGNFAPRVGIAYQSRRWPGTTARAGFGIYYDLGNGQAAQAFGSVFPFTRGRSIGLVPFPLTPEDAEPRTPGGAASHSTLFAFDPGLRLPYTRHWSIALERHLGAHHTLSVSYLGAQGRRLLREDVFYFAPPFLPEAVSDRTIVLTTGSARSDYHAVQAQLRRRLSRGFEAFATYTWSHSVDTASDDSTLHRFNVFAPDPAFDRGPSDFDVRNSANAAVSYEVPTFFKGTFLSALGCHWRVDALARWRTATPVNVAGSSIIASGGLFVNGRPNQVSNVPFYVRDVRVPGGRFVNPEAFTTVAGVGTPLRRNALRGFSASQIDITLRREFKLSDGLKLQLRAEVFNLLNHPNFANPAPVLGNFGDPLLPNQPLGFAATETLGQSLGSGGAIGGLIPMYQIGSARSVQLGIKLQF